MSNPNGRTKDRGGERDRREREKEGKKAKAGDGFLRGAAWKREAVRPIAAFVWA